MGLVWVCAWATGLWALLNNFTKGRGNVPPALWWTTLPFSIVGGMTHGVLKSAAAGIAAGLLAALVVHLWASARAARREVRTEDAASLIGHWGVVTETLYSIDKGRLNLEGRVLIDSNRDVNAITVGTTAKVEIPKGARVRVVGHDGGNRIIVEPVGKSNGDYLLQ